MEWMYHILGYAVPFVVVLSVLVFVHELGHYLVARWCGVKIETFSIGFGREIIGFTDKAGTRWKFSLIPLGGYVQMYGDTDPTSTNTDLATLNHMDEKERNVAFFFKPVWQRALIVFAGPAINFLYAILVLTALFSIEGQPYTPALVGGLAKEGVAIESGFKLKDKVVSVNGQEIERFQQLQRLVTVNLGR
ncbi:MAG TPA: site-2 protease family protein, partial [Alphaproteobacteria bacterium]